MLVGDTPRDLDRVRPHRRRRRHLPRAPTVEHLVAGSVAADQDRVERPRDRREGRGGGDERRMHASLERAVGHLGDREELHPVPELPRVGDLDRLEPRDARRVDVLQVDAGPESERGQDLELVRRVDPLDVERRVRLRVPRRLSLAQGVGEIPSLVRHLGQDEVRGAVDDALERQDPVRGEAVAERADDGHAARDGGLEAEEDAAPPRGGEELGPVRRQEGLVRGHDVLAGVERAEDVGARRLEAADHLDDDRHRRVGEDPLGIGAERPRGGLETLAGRG